MDSSPDAASGALSGAAAATLARRRQTGAGRRLDRLAVLQWLTVLVPAVCAGLYETVRHTLLATELPNLLGTLVAVALVLAISSIFARVSFGMIRRTEASLRERNRELHALSREVERLAVSQERDRLAREMHDSVAQVLAYLLVRLDTIEGLLARGRNAEAAHEVRQLRASGEEAYADVREAIAGLRTRPEAGAAGLAAALEQYVREFGDRVGAEASFSAAGFDLATAGEPAGELTPAAEMQLMRIAQEALANVRKHAHATRVLVQLRRDGAGWSLTVRDDGVGFDPRASEAAASNRHHFGLAIMRERAESLGGTLAIETAPGTGTTITVQLPHSPSPGTARVAAAGNTRKEHERGAPAALAG